MKTKKTKNKETDGCGFELEGKVYVWEIKDGKKTSTELDGQLVLKCLLHTLEQSLDYLEKKKSKK